LDAGAIADCLGVPTFDIACFLWTAGDLDGSPPAEIVGLDVTDFCSKTPPRVQRSRLIILKQVQGGSSPGLTCQRYELLPARGLAEELFLADLNGDQRPELVVRFSSSILVYWNTGSGLDPGAANVSPVPPPPGSGLMPFVPLAVTAINAGPGPDLQIAYATTSGVFSSAFDAGRIFHTRRGSVVPFQPIGRQIAGAVAGTAGSWRLRAADIDRDGLDDLVLLEGERVHVYPAVAHKAIGAGP
jgi:hypothetical protein